MKRIPRSGAHAELGELLRSSRQAAGIPTRGVGFSAGHVSNVENGHVTPSFEMLEAYIRLGVDRVRATDLLDRARRYREPIMRPVRGCGPPTSLAAVTDPSDVAGHYVVTSFEGEFSYDGTGCLVSQTFTVRIRALSDGVCLYYASQTPNGGCGRPQQLDVTPLSGVTVVDVVDHASGAADLYFRLDRALDVDDGERVLSFRTVPSPRQLAESGVGFRASWGSESCTFSLRFDSDCAPDDVWSFAGPDLISASRPGPDDRLAPVAEGHYTHQVDTVVSGWFHGVLWVWPPHPSM